MERIYKTISGVTYAVLDAALRRLGYVREEGERGVTYQNPAEPKARILLPRLALTEEVRGIDFVATQAILEGFGIAEPQDFDLLLAEARADSSGAERPRPRRGSAKGVISHMAEDFDAPLEDMREYSE